ncbi:hypothetical protein [Streptomyces sp. NBC_01236]|uniref:hypothetical protein n=1 Tax=Streptomyces sp. NBC_01236 TaxID=2903789 RepID=UPI002E142ABC|nr:hypothetical protein OG324_51030 [Streptomyces sp. NBC_01236]
MSTMCRRLGTGPTIPSPSPAGDEQPRLLAAERVDPGALLEVRGDHEQAPLKSRRMLGTGHQSGAS